MKRGAPILYTALLLACGGRSTLDLPFPVAHTSTPALDFGISACGGTGNVLTVALTNDPTAPPLSWTAATRAGALDAHGRESLLKYVLRPPIAQERVVRGPDGLVRIALKRAFSDGTTAIDMDPLSLLASPRRSRLPEPTRSSTRACWARPASSARASCRARRARPPPRKKRRSRRRAPAPGIAHGLSC